MIGAPLQHEKVDPANGDDGGALDDEDDGVGGRLEAAD